MKKLFDNPLVDFDGTVKPAEDTYRKEPDWDELIIGPCVRTPGWDGDDYDDDEK